MWPAVILPSTLGIEGSPKQQKTLFTKRVLGRTRKFGHVFFVRTPLKNCIII